MKAKILAWAAVATLLACNIYCMALLAAERKNAEASLNTLYPFAEKYEILKSSIKSNIEFGGLGFPEIRVCNIQGVDIDLKRLFSDGKKLVFFVRASERYCHTCVDYAVSLMRNSKIRKGIPIYYLFGCQRNNVFGAESERYGLADSLAFNCPDLGILSDYAGFPYIMAVNANLDIEYCYFPNKGNEGIDIENINLVIDCFLSRYCKE